MKFCIKIAAIPEELILWFYEAPWTTWKVCTSFGLLEWKALVLYKSKLQMSLSNQFWTQLKAIYSFVRFWCSFLWIFVILIFFTLFDFDFLNPLFCFPSFCIVLCCTCHFLWLFSCLLLCSLWYFGDDKTYLPLCHLFCKVLNFQSAGWLLIRVEGGTYTCPTGSFLAKVFNLKYHRLHLLFLMVL